MQISKAGLYEPPATYTRNNDLKSLQKIIQMRLEEKYLNFFPSHLMVSDFVNET